MKWNGATFKQIPNLCFSVTALLRHNYFVGIYFTYLQQISIVLYMSKVQPCIITTVIPPYLSHYFPLPYLCCAASFSTLNLTLDGSSDFFCVHADLSICWYKSFEELLSVSSLVQRDVNIPLLSTVRYSLRLKLSGTPEKNACWMQLTSHNTLLPLKMFVSVSRCHSAKSQELKFTFSSTIL